MSVTAGSVVRTSSRLDVWRQILLLVGFVAMYAPSYFDTARRFWVRDEESHGPIILAIILWLLWRERKALIGTPSATEQCVGFTTFSIGLVLYIVGRSQEFFQFDIGSQAFVIAGLALGLGGQRALRRYWFPAFFTIFVVPIPPSLLDQILVPLKVTVSNVVTEGLYSLGLPISNSGVVLVIGQYELLVADACSGLRSMIALTGIGFLYTFIAGRTGGLANSVLLVSAIPIAFFANVLRVTALVLVTFWFGSSAGVEFHDFAGYFEIALAFGSFFMLDALIGRFITVRKVERFVRET